jgi:hypothetical protein
VMFIASYHLPVVFVVSTCLKFKVLQVHMAFHWMKRKGLLEMQNFTEALQNAIWGQSCYISRSCRQIRR